MAETNTPKKRWFWGILRDAIVSAGIALGLDSWVRDWVKDLFTKHVGPIAGETIKQKFTDKRAEMLREFRMMNDAGINIDNLIRRHAESMDRSKIDRLEEYRFVELLCKIPPPDPASPSTARPPVTPGTSGTPQNERQADLKWLNDMDDKKFGQMMYFLDHDVIVQWYQVGCDRGTQILKMIWGDLKAAKRNIAQWLRTHFGALGDWIVDTVEAIVDSLARFFRWLSGSWLRVAAVAVVSVPVLLFVALIIGPIRRRVFPWLGMAIGVLLVTLAYYLLVPTSLDKTLSLAFLMLLTAAFFLWKFAPVRNTIFGLLVLFTLIFFLGGRTAAKDAAKAVWTSAGTKSSSDTTATTDTQRQAPPKSKGQPADASGESTDKSEKKTLPDSPAQPAQSAPAPAPLATIYPLSGEKGNLVPIMHDCYYASADVVTCEGSVVNMDGDRIKHGVYLMDSQGSVNTQDGRGEQFSVWTFGGSLQFSGGTDFAQVIPGMSSPFVFSFRENTGRAELVGITLTLKSAADSRNSTFTFANVPVADHRS